jgi:hypothetical protein
MPNSHPREDCEVEIGKGEEEERNEERKMEELRQEVRVIEGIVKTKSPKTGRGKREIELAGADWLIVKREAICYFVAKLDCQSM